MCDLTIAVNSVTKVQCGGPPKTGSLLVTPHRCLADNLFAKTVLGTVTWERLVTENQRCLCGQLAERSSMPGMPYRYDSESDSFSLVLSASVCQSNAFCCFCGGLKDGPLTQDPRICSCGAVERWAENPSLPVEWNTIGQNMYGIWCTDCESGALAIWFCPACGGFVPTRARPQSESSSM